MVARKRVQVERGAPLQLHHLMQGGAALSHQAVTHRDLAMQGLVLLPQRPLLDMVVTVPRQVVTAHQAALLGPHRPLQPTVVMELREVLRQRRLMVTTIWVEIMVRTLRAMDLPGAHMTLTARPIQQRQLQALRGPTAHRWLLQALPVHTTRTDGRSNLGQRVADKSIVGKR